jgi:solute carrier family 13 (sodium-dependent dicarboxylate transporter), member 2/3/5
MSASIAIAAAAPAQERFGAIKIAGAIAAPLALLALWSANLGLEPRGQHALAICAFMVVLWITETVPHAITGLIGCWLFWALKVAPIRVAFSGFASSEAPWFLLGALFIGIMVTETGLARRLAFQVLAWIGKSYSSILLALLLVNFVMTAMIPAGPPRVILLGSLALGVAASFGFGAKSNLAKGLILAVTFSATLNDKTILGSTPAILAHSLIIEHGKVSLLWSQWFLAYLPLGTANLLAIWWYVKKFYKPEVEAMPGGKAAWRDQLNALGPWSAREMRAAFWTGLALVLWSTDWAHHLGPGVIGMGVGLAATLPVIGAVKMDDLKKVNFFIVLFMGTALSMAEVLRDSGAVGVISNAMFGMIEPWMTSISNATWVLYWSGFLAHILLASETSMVSVTMPVIMRFAADTQLSPLQMGLIWSMATGGKLFIYQSLVLIAGYTFNSYGAKEIAKIGGFFLFFQFVMLLLIVNFYWPLVGIR